VLAPLLAGVGPACVKAEDDHPPRVWPPLSLEELHAADAAMELLPLFGGLLRDILLAMRPAGARWVGAGDARQPFASCVVRHTRPGAYSGHSFQLAADG
jgi:hypothetical protein